ncbi:50S ribosomal protein L6 [bacterium]|nr:50S ribosomal protein L6 [bacterium]
MSRIGKLPIEVPKGVDVNITKNKVTVKGPKGTLEKEFLPEVDILMEDNKILVKRHGDTGPKKAVHGLTRALLANMVTGVSTGFSKKLEIHGVGYKVGLSGKKIILNVGYSNPVEVEIPKGLECTIEGSKGKENILIISGHNNEQVGQFSADVRKIRPPEPYKGKGIRYSNEYVRRKAGKRGVK